MKSDYFNQSSVAGFALKLWRGERMVLLGMDVEAPEADFVGFSIEVQSPGGTGFKPLRNRLAFAYPTGAAVDGYRNFSSLEAPFQKFRWIHFPYQPKAGSYTYRVTKQHMKADGSLSAGTAITLDILLSPVVYDGVLDIGFTRSFASSQAYVDLFGNNANIIPAEAADGLSFQKLKTDPDVYQWLGFEAYDLVFGFLKGVVADETLELDFFAYDLNEPDIVGLLEQLGPRLRAIIDDSKDHKPDTAAESIAAARLARSAGASQVIRGHFSNLQHNKVMIAKRDGKAVKVLFGSTNYSFRGLYIQANNALVFYSPDVASKFEEYFELAFHSMQKFAAQPITKQWHLVQVNAIPPVHLCLSPHADPDLSLGPVGAAIDQATSSVFFAIAFLSQAKTGAVREAIDRLADKSLFSYGISDRVGGLEVKKPDGSTGIVDFNYLADKAPEPFKSEWSGGKGIHEHHKFVVTDFNLPTAKVFTGSCNMSESGENKNGDNLIMIEDPKVATAYAIEAIRVFDHLEFRSKMGAADAHNDPLTLQKPTALSGKPAWYEKFYVDGSQLARDRTLFSS